MPGFKLIYDKKEDIPATVDDFASLFVEKGGKWEINGIEGLKTAGDIARVEKSLKAERDEHAKTKAALGAWGDMKHEDVVAKLDRIAELEEAAKGKLDDAKIDELVNRRLESTLKARLGPVEREAKKAKEEHALLLKENAELKAREARRAIHDHVRAAAQSEKVSPDAMEDVLLNAELMFEIGEDGRPVTRELAGASPGRSVAAGLDAAAWLEEMKAKRPLWWPQSEGGGSRGSGGGGGGGKNPWSRPAWNITEQGKIIAEKGMETAEKLAAAAGSRVGATTPPPERRSAS